MKYILAFLMLLSVVPVQAGSVLEFLEGIEQSNNQNNSKEKISIKKKTKRNKRKPGKRSDNCIIENREPGPEDNCSITTKFMLAVLPFMVGITHIYAYCSSSNIIYAKPLPFHSDPFSNYALGQ